MDKKILILILILSVILISCKEKKYEINGFEVEKMDDNYYRIKLNVEKDMVRSIYYTNVRYDPKELKDINVDKDIKSKVLNSNQLYLVMNPNANYSGKVTIAALEIKKFVSNPLLWNKNASAAFTEPYNGIENFKIKKCDESDINETVILFKTGDEDKVYFDNCIIVQGKDEEGMIRSADRLVLSLIGVY